MDKPLFGAAYYDEYMPYARLEKDVNMLKRAGMNVVRIAESTWSTCEPQPGVFDFTHVERVMFCLNYTADAKTLRVPAGKELIDNRKIECDQEIAFEPWGVAIIEEA